MTSSITCSTNILNIRALKLSQVFKTKTNYLYIGPIFPCWSKTTHSKLNDTLKYVSHYYISKMDIRFPILIRRTYVSKTRKNLFISIPKRGRENILKTKLI